MNGGRKRLLIGAIAVVLVSAAVAVVLIIRSTSDKPLAGPPEPLNGRGICSDNVVVYLKTDADMLSVAPKLAADPQVVKVYTETKQEAWQHFQKIFAKQPETLKLGNEQLMPATITVRPADGVSLKDFADHVRAETPQADRVEPVSINNPPPGMTVTAKPDPCPASGER